MGLQNGLQYPKIPSVLRESASKIVDSDSDDLRFGFGCVRFTPGRTKSYASDILLAVYTIARDDSQARSKPVEHGLTASKT